MYSVYRENIIKPDKILCCMLLFTFFALTVRRTQVAVVYFWLRNQPIEKRWLHNLFICISAKQKIAHGYGLSNIDLDILVGSLMFAGLHNHFLLVTMCFLTLRKRAFNSFFFSCALALPNAHYSYCVLQKAKMLRFNFPFGRMLA